MKKILMILAVTTMAVSPVLTTQAQAASRTTVTKKFDVKHGKKTVTKRVITKTSTSKLYNKKPGNHRSKVAATKVRWSKGQRFNRRIATNYRTINNPRAYRLKNAPHGQRWVRSGNDAVLIGITSGIVSAVIADALRG
ncbi:MAG: RcnB family protein [Parasphingorhabdus sp.]